MRLRRRGSELPNLGNLAILITLKRQQTAHNGLPLIIPRERLNISTKHPPLRARVELRRDLSAKNRAQSRVSDRHGCTRNSGMTKRALQLRLIRQRHREHLPDRVLIELPEPFTVNLSEPVHALRGHHQKTVRRTSVPRSHRHKRRQCPFPGVPQGCRLVRRVRKNQNVRLTIPTMRNRQE